MVLTPLSARGLGAGCVSHVYALLRSRCPVRDSRCDCQLCVILLDLLVGQRGRRRSPTPVTSTPYAPENRSSSKFESPVKRAELASKPARASRGSTQLRESAGLAFVCRRSEEHTSEL